MTRRPILLLVNPVAGGKIGSGPDLSDDPAEMEPQALARALGDRGLTVELRELREEDDVHALSVDAAAGGFDVVAAGGDGTVSRVAAALLGSEATLGILARGSFNNMATGYRVPTTLDDALDVIGAGDVSVVDAGEAFRGEGGEEGHLFFEAAGVGLDAVGFLAVEVSERHGRWRAMRSLWRGLRRRRTPMRLTIDGVRYRTGSPSVTVCNGPYHGLGFALAPDADPTDGLLDVAIFFGMNRWQVIRHFLAIARHKRQREPRVRVVRARSITVEGMRAALPAHADGVTIGFTPVRFEVRPGTLRIFR